VDVDVKASFEELRKLYADTQAKAAPLLAKLRPWIQAAQHAEKLGLTADSTADQIIDAFANSVDFADMPQRPLIPQVLKAGAPAAIAEAGRQVEKINVDVGTAVGTLAGAIVGAMR